MFCNYSNKEYFNKKYFNEIVSHMAEMIRVHHYQWVNRCLYLINPKIITLQTNQNLIKFHIFSWALIKFTMFSPRYFFSVCSTDSMSDFVKTPHNLCGITVRLHKILMVTSSRYTSSTTYTKISYCYHFLCIHTLGDNISFVGFLIRIEGWNDKTVTGMKYLNF